MSASAAWLLIPFAIIWLPVLLAWMEERRG